jgi:hypothetical protein
MARLEVILFSGRKHEEIKIKVDEFGKPGKIIVQTSSVTILECSDDLIDPNQQELI